MILGDRYLDICLPVAICHACKGVDGSMANGTEAKDRTSVEDKYLDIRLPVAICHTTGVEASVANGT